MSASGGKKSENLEAIENSPAGSKKEPAFDQFKGRKTDFSMDTYSINMPTDVSPELRARADRVESDINNKDKKAAGSMPSSTSMMDRDEEQIISLVDDDCKLRRERKLAEAIVESEEQMFGTAVPQGQTADESTAFDRSKIEADVDAEQ